MSNLQQIIENAFEKRAEITPKTVDAQTSPKKLTANGLLTNG